MAINAQQALRLCSLSIVKSSLSFGWLEAPHNYVYKCLNLRSMAYYWFRESGPRDLS